MISLLDIYLANNEEEKEQQLVSSVSRDASKILKMTTINISTIHHILQNKGIDLLLLSPPSLSVGNTCKGTFLLCMLNVLVHCVHDLIYHVVFVSFSSDVCTCTCRR